MHALTNYRSLETFILPLWTIAIMKCGPYFWCLQQYLHCLQQYLPDEPVEEPSTEGWWASYCLRAVIKGLGARPTVGAALFFSFALQTSVWCHNTCMLFTSSPPCIQPGSHEITKWRVEIDKKSIVSLPFTIFSAALKENFVLVKPTVEPKNMYSNGLVVHVWGAAAL